MSEQTGRKKVLYIRRAVQVLTLSVLVALPLLSANPYQWSPSRIVLGHLPPPVVLPVSGDTWSFHLWGFSLVHPLAFVESVLATKIFYVPLIYAVVVPLGITVFLGRVFCSWHCPVGFLLELNQKSYILLRRLGLGKAVLRADIRYPVLAFSLLFGLAFSVPVLSVFLDPPHLLGRELMYLFTHHQISLSGAGILLGIVGIDTFSTKRTWCGLLCPSGGGLSLLGRWRALRISLDPSRCTRCEICNRVCPYELRPMVLVEDTGAFNWTKCDNCGLCRDHCPTGAIYYTLRKEK